jgi:hypothetical protein
VWTFTCFGVGSSDTVNRTNALSVAITQTTHVVAYAMNNVIAGLVALSPGLFAPRDPLTHITKKNEHDTSINNERQRSPEVEAVAVTTEDGKKHYQCHSPGRYGDEKASATQRITTPDAADAAIEKPQIRCKAGGGH